MFQLGSLKDKALALKLKQEMEELGLSVVLQSQDEDYYLFVEKESDFPAALDHYRVALGIPKSFEAPEEYNRLRTLPLGKVSLFIIGVCVILFGVNLLGEKNSFYSHFMFSNQHQSLFYEIKNGQIWRLVTPAFLHFGFLHLFFNLLWLKDLGTLIEWKRGRAFFIVFLLILAIVSNLTQYLTFGPRFGGMSGVVYGFLGYIWVYRALIPKYPLGLPKSDVVMMIIWFFLCLFGVFGPIANVAHAAGLSMGMLVGLVLAFKEGAKQWLLCLRFAWLSLFFLAFTLVIEYLKLNKQFYFNIYPSL